MALLVTCLTHARIGGGVATVEVEQLELGDALTRSYATDAHFQCVTVSRFKRRRFTTRDIGSIDTVIEAIAFDVDGPNHLATEDWWAGELAKVDALLAANPGAFVYRTRGGYRIVWRLAERFELRSTDDAAEWKHRYLVLADELERFGIVVDRSCADAFRLFRAPHATRELGGAPEALPVLGNPHAIGVIELPEAAPAAPRGLTLPPRCERSEQHGGGVASDTPSEPTPLLRELQRAGLVVGPGPSAGSLRIICPRDLAHTTGTPGDGSSVYYPPRDYCGSGAIHCKHGHCDAIRTARQWRRAIARYSGHRSSLRSLRAGGVGS